MTDIISQTSANTAHPAKNVPKNPRRNANSHESSRAFSLSRDILTASSHRHIELNSSYSKCSYRCYYTDNSPASIKGITDFGNFRSQEINFSMKSFNLEIMNIFMDKLIIQENHLV